MRIIKGLEIRIWWLEQSGEGEVGKLKIDISLSIFAKNDVIVMFTAISNFQELTKDGSGIKTGGWENVQKSTSGAWTIIQYSRVTLG